MIARTLDDQFGRVGGDAGRVTGGAVIEAGVLRVHGLDREHAAPPVHGADARAGDKVRRLVIDRPLNAHRLIAVSYNALKRKVITEKSWFWTSHERCNLGRN